MPGKVPEKIDAFGSSEYPVRRALCPVCCVMIPVVTATAGALKDKLVIADHKSIYLIGMSCKGVGTRVVLPREVEWPAAA